MKKYIPLTIGLLGVLILLAFAVGQGRAQEGRLAEEASLPGEVDNAVANYIPVQGRLADAGGNPLDGDYSITFRLYAVPSGGTELCHDTNAVQVDKGLFNSEIWGNCQDQMTGQQLYLGIEVGTDGEMTPRQPIYAVPYAWSLRPGAVISASMGTTPNLHLETWSTNGRGLRAYAMSTTGTNYGIVGATRSPDGYGGYFYNNHGGVGLYGEAISTTAGTGVRGMSEVGSGVNGVSTSGNGITGVSDSSYGVYGQSTSNIGIWGQSQDSYGVLGNTARTDQNYGLYTNDNLYSLNYHLKGAVRQLVQNGGTEPLEAGDVVVFSGILAPADASDSPVILVSRVATADSTAVAGVVFGRYSAQGDALEGPAQPGDYLLVVVQGPARVKASAAAGAIKPGDLLSSNAQAGVAASVTALPGATFAKALEALESGEGWIYVYVTLH